MIYNYNLLAKAFMKVEYYSKTLEYCKKSIEIVKNNKLEPYFQIDEINDMLKQCSEKTIEKIFD